MGRFVVQIFACGFKGSIVVLHSFGESELKLFSALELVLW